MFLGSGASMTDDFSMVVPMIQFLALIALVSGNSLRIRFKHSFLAKMLSGLGGSVFTALVILGVILFLKDIRYVDDKAALLVPYILSQMAFLAAGILGIVGFSDSAHPEMLSKTSQILLMCGYALLVFSFILWILILSSGSGGGAVVWSVLLVARFFFYALAFFGALVYGFISLMAQSVYKVEL